MFQLEENQVLDRAKIAQWFGIAENSFSRTKEKKLEELSNYCEYELQTTKKGNLKSVTIKTVYCPTYQTTEGKKLMNWLESGDRWEETADDHVSSCAIVTNYYCKLHNIPYDGPHYIFVEVVGYSESNGHREKVVQNKKKPNPEYTLWHYLYNKVSAYYTNKDRVDYYKYDLSTGEWNPTKAVLTTEAMLKLRNDIGARYYGGNLYNDAEEFVDTLANEFLDEDEEATIKITRQELMNMTLYAKLTDKAKRTMIAQEQKENGVLKRDGVKRKAEEEG